MRVLMNYFNDFIDMIPTLSVWDVLDILVVAFIVYKVITMIHSSAASRIIRAIVLLLIATAMTNVLKLRSLNYILEKILELGIIALVIVFQPELRRALERIGGRSLKELWQGREQISQYEAVIAQVVTACELMSKERVGALIVFERSTSVAEYFKTGTVLNARVSPELIRNIFFPKAALHDGAMVIQGNQIAAAGCVLPLSENTHLSSDLGTRHRAGVGISEVSDAVVVIVSEENGTISMAEGGMLKRHLAPQMLEKLLTNELIPQEKKPVDEGVGSWLRRKLNREGKKHEKK